MTFKQDICYKNLWWLKCPHDCFLAPFFLHLLEQYPWTHQSGLAFDLKHVISRGSVLEWFCFCRQGLFPWCQLRLNARPYTSISKASLHRFQSIACNGECQVPDAPGLNTKPCLSRLDFSTGTKQSSNFIQFQWERYFTSLRPWLGYFEWILYPGFSSGTNESCLPADREILLQD